ncbi:hypothetical protein D3C87_1808190 [compost metagenome]
MAGHVRPFALGRPEAGHGGFQPAEGRHMGQGHDRQGQGVAAVVLGAEQAREDDDRQETDQPLQDIGGQIAQHSTPEHQRTDIRSPSKTGMVTAITQRSSQKDCRSI